MIWVLTAGVEAGGRQEFPRLQGPYLGQKPPELIPQLFAPGIITTDEEEGSSGFARNGTVFLFQKFINTPSQTGIRRLCHTFISRLENGAWTAPPNGSPSGRPWLATGISLFRATTKRCFIR